MKSIKIASERDSELTRYQLLFNKLAIKIEQLENDLIETERKLVTLKEEYNLKLKPIIIENAKAKFNLAMSLGKATQRVPFWSDEKYKITEIIVDLCEQALMYIQPTATQQVFFHYWQKQAKEYESRNIEYEAKHYLNEFIKKEFGVNIDISKLKQNPEAYYKFKERLKKMVEDKNHFEEKIEVPIIETEKRYSREEKMKHQSLRNIYITLAKVLHPDAEPDENKRAEKEEAMKRVTVAYEEKDFIGLLKMEMTWIQDQNNSLESLSDERLKIYNSILHEQTQDLEMNIESLYCHPNFTEIEDFSRFPEKKAIIYLNNEIHNEKALYNKLSSIINRVEKDNSKKAILEFIEEYLDEAGNDDSQ